MARDFEDMYDLPSMEDEEIRDLIADQLSEHAQIDQDNFEIQVESGRVTLSGRVGTEAELHAIEQVLTDVIGVSDLNNEIVVDETRRYELPEAADDAHVERLALEGNTSAGANRTEDSAEHLLTDTAAEHFGTGSVQEAVERGYSYNPPTSPVQEGSRSVEDH